MLVYDRAYLELRNRYLVPLSNYSVQCNHLQSNNIKNLLLKATSIDTLNDKEFIFRFEEEKLLKGLLGDIELFYIKHVLQKNDAHICSNLDLSANWNIVSNYYYAFFAASLMLRLCHRGNIFLDLELKRNIEILISNIKGDVIKLDSNQFYEVLYSDSEGYSLKITPSSDGTHEVVWRKMDQLIDEMLLLSRQKSEERLILTYIKDINKQLTNTYPSKLRNRVNYQPLYGLRYIENKLYPIYERDTWVEQLLRFEKTDDDNQISTYMFSYAKYIEHFCENMIAEYYQLRGHENGLLKKINKDRSEKIGAVKLKYYF